MNREEHRHRDRGPDRTEAHKQDNLVFRESRDQREAFRGIERQWASETEMERDRYNRIRNAGAAEKASKRQSCVLLVT